MALLHNKMALPDISKLEPLDGTNYKRWSQKLLIYYERLEIHQFLFTDPPKIPQNVGAGDSANIEGASVDAATIAEATKALEVYDKYNKLVRGHLLNHMPKNFV